MEEQSVIVTLKMPKELAVKSRVKAASMDISRSELIRRAVENYIKVLNERDNKRNKNR